MRPQKTFSILAMVAVLATSGVMAVAPRVASAAGPSVGLPPINSVSVVRQSTASRPPDPASANALHGNQQERGAKDGAGTSQATSLSPSTTWDVAAHTGDFTMSYPLRVPPAPGGLGPQLALSYRSSAVDGRTSVTNNQPSWIGDGWDLSPGFVERTYAGCADDINGGSTPKTGDLCWRSDNATASYNGGGGTLIRDDASGAWHPKNDDGARVERLNGAGNGAHDGEYWKITTVDGTQYFFGSEGDSKSAWTVPVYGANAGEPCHGATFDASWCTQAWRWNLDKVIDRNGNVMRYLYEPESSSYGQNMQDTPVSYIRGGNLVRVEYGLNQSVSAPATGLVLFTLADRCIPGSDCSQSSKGNWPDTPLDRLCSGAACTQHSPSYFSTRRLASIATQVRSGSGYSDVDRWTLDQQYPDPGSGEKAALWLKGITHTGLVGGSVALPSVTFEGNQFANRVFKTDGVSSLNRYRLTGIVSESGGVTSVTYAPPECVDGGPMPASPETNAMRCFPVRWARPGEQERTDYFHKYVVAQVVQSDRLSSSTEQVSSYEYLDGAAWHFDMSEFAKDDKKTWNEFRGYGRVRVRAGAAGDPSGPITMSEQRFYRGMNGDRLPGGTRSVSVTDSEGGAHADEDWLAGASYEGRTFENAALSSEPDPAVVSKTITDPVWRGPTATRGAFQAYQVRPGAQRQLTALKAGGWRITRADTTYDELGLPVTVNDLGDIGMAADDRCTTTSYARDGAAWLMNLPARVETVGAACGTTPTFPRDAISDTRMTYDSSGNLTRTEIAAERPAAGPVYVVQGTAQHDVHGRIVASTDPAGNTTTTSFVPATGGPVTSTTTTTPPTPAVPGGLVTTADLEPEFGQQILLTDPNGRQTATAYDPLGRKTMVWLPNRPRTTYPNQPSFTFSYLIRKDAPTVVSTTQLGPNGLYTTNSTLFDGLLRPRQVQAPAVGGGRLLTDTRYDSQGRTYKHTQPYFNDNAVDDQLWVAADTDVAGLTRTEFDGAGRAVASVYQAGATERWRSTTEYGGDRVSVTPPAGGTATTGITDARGQLIELRQYRASSPSGAYESTSHTYDPAGHLTQLVAPGGATWRYGYDLRGRKITSDDPDGGLTALSYDDSGHLVSTRDARGVVLAYTYDAIGRSTEEHQDSPSGPKLAQWTYDTVPNGKGQAATATRFVDGNAYTTSVASYSSLYEPTQASVTIPDSEGLLAGTYTWFTRYGWDGSVSGESYPAVGGLPEETVNHVLDDEGRPLTSSGAYNGTVVDLVTGTNYTRYGEPQRVQLGSGTKRTWLSYYYDDSTRRLARSIVDTETAAPMQSDAHYTYDPAGNITSIADTPAGQTADNQCFHYDHVRRLTEAWTPTGQCTDAPSTSGLGGPAAYWQSYTYDGNGNRVSETTHAAAGDTVRGYAYPNPGAPQPHAVSSIASTGAATDTYSYDPAGNTTSRTKAGVGQSLTWDAEGHLASSTTDGKTTSYVYSAGGVRLLRKEPTGTILYLGKQEVRLAATGGSPVATRHYTHGAKVVAVRRGATLTWLAGDHQATAQLAIDAQSLAVNRRRQMPFGSPRGNAPASWPDDHGFVGGVQDSSTGLSHLGAREYDPTIGRFISVDPVMDQADPQQWNGYAYADNSPITNADPSGLWFTNAPDGECSRGCPFKPGQGPASTCCNTPVQHSPTGRQTPPPRSVKGIGAAGIAEARGQASDMAILAKRDGWRTNFVFIDIMVKVPNGTQNVGAEYDLVPGIIIGLSFEPVTQCFTPSDPQHPVFDVPMSTRAEQAAWDAAHPQPKPAQPPMTIQQFLGAITGADQIVDCIQNPSFGGCLEAAAPFAAGLFGKVVGGAARFFTGASAAEKAVAASGDFVSVYHGSVRDATSIRANGLDPSRGSTWVSRDRRAAENATTSPPRQPGEVGDSGIIESRIPRAEYERMLASSERDYPGWSSDLPGSSEIVLRTPEQIELFNRYRVGGS
jgi:RHS repeat-associated protein